AAADSSAPAVVRDDEVEVLVGGRVAATHALVQSFGRAVVRAGAAGGLPPGLAAALPGARVGSRVVARVASELAFGERGVPGVVPPSASLEYDVEILRVVGAPQQHCAAGAGADSLAETADEARERGNALFAAGRLGEAAAAYVAALRAQ